MSDTTIHCDPTTSSTNQDAPRGRAYAEGEAAIEEMEIRFAARLTRNARSTTRIRIVCAADIGPEL